jgi:hypothetical protein
MKLNKYSKKMYSQIVEDGIIKYLFKTSKMQIRKIYFKIIRRLLSPSKEVRINLKKSKLDY